MRVYWHVTSYQNWPAIRDGGLRPGSDGHVWLFTDPGQAVHFSDAWSGGAWRESVPPEQWKVPPCIVVVRTDRAVETEAGIPGAYWVEGPVTKAEVYDVIRPADIHYYEPDRKRFTEGSKIAANGVWYHASPVRLEPGTALRAGEVRFMRQVEGKVYFSPDPWVAIKHVGGITKLLDEKAYLYRVEPVGDIEDDPEAVEFGYFGASYMADDAVVVRRYDGEDSLREILGLPDQPYLDGRAAMQVEADEDHDTDVMICLRPSEALRKVFADMDECTQPVDDLHITLYYLGEMEEDCGGEMGRERLFRGVYDFAIHSGYRGLTGNVNGWGQFMNPDANSLIALWDIPGIAEFRTRLIDYCKAHGFQPRQDDHGFTPHMSIGHSDERYTAFPEIPDGNPEKEIFGSVWIVWGEDWQKIELP